MAYKTSIISIKLEGELVAQQISVNATVRSSKNPQQTCHIRLRWAASSIVVEEVCLPTVVHLV